MERLQANYDIDVVFRAFPLHPETPDEGLTLEQLFAGRNIDIPAAQSRMSSLMKEEGLPYGNRTMTYNSRLAQELAAWAVTQSGGAGVHNALFQAYFVDGCNLAAVEELLKLIATLGLPESDAKQVLATRSYRQAVDDDWQRSRELGVTGVPTYVCNDTGVVGAQPFEVLEQLVTAAGAKPRDR